jgi:dihydrofolate reductase
VLQQTNNSRNGYIIAKKSWEADLPENRQKILACCDVFCLTRTGRFNIPKEQQGKQYCSLDHALSEIRSTLIPPQKVFICGGINLYQEAFMRGIVNQCILSFLPNDYACDLHLNFIRDNLKDQFNQTLKDKRHRQFHVEYWERKQPD